MALHTITRGLDVPIGGAPEQSVGECNAITHAGLVADDYVGLRARVLVDVHDAVKRGQTLFEDEQTGVRYTSPREGTVSAIHRERDDALRSVVVEAVETDEQVALTTYTGKVPEQIAQREVIDLLVESGLWTAFRTRPFNRVPRPSDAPEAIFVNAMDTQPLAPSMDVAYEGRDDDYAFGMYCVAKLSVGTTYLCTRRKSAVPGFPNAGVQHEWFEGPHPAGTMGLHAHRLRPIFRGRTLWHLGLQDLLAIGRLFRTGTLDTDRIVSLAGPSVTRPRLVRVPLGASVDELVAGELRGGKHRAISGSVLHGRRAMGERDVYLGRYHQCVSVLPDAVAATSSAVPPVGAYQRVFPFEMEPTMLLRAVLDGDAEEAERLGCLELDEEDLALCAYVCPSKHDYAPAMRRILRELERGT